MKRKSIVVALFGAVALSLLFYSCTKDQPELVNQVQIESIVMEADDAIISEEILDEVLEDLEKYDFLKSTSDCPVRTIEKPEEGRYPIIVTKDYGDGCAVHPNGRMRSGKIIITVNGPWCREGSVRKVAFEDYKHGNTLVVGSKKIKCLGESDEGYIWHRITGNLQLTREKDEEDLVIKRIVKKDRFLITGLKDKDVPREWLIEGEIKVEKSNDVSYKVSTAEPLHRIQGCRWYQSGIKQIELKEDLIQIDYSYVGPEDSSCDSWIKRWVNEEEPELIDLSAGP